MLIGCNTQLVVSRCRYWLIIFLLLQLQKAKSFASYDLGCTKRYSPGGNNCIPFFVSSVGSEGAGSLSLISHRGFSLVSKLFYRTLAVFAALIVISGYKQFHTPHIYFLRHTHISQQSHANTILLTPLLE